MSGIVESLQKYQMLNPECHQEKPTVVELCGSPMSFASERTNPNESSDEEREDIDGLTQSLLKATELLSFVDDANGSKSQTTTDFIETLQRNYSKRRKTASYESPLPGPNRLLTNHPFPLPFQEPIPVFKTNPTREFRNSTIVKAIKTFAIKTLDPNETICNMIKELHLEANVTRHHQYYPPEDPCYEDKTGINIVRVSTGGSGINKDQENPQSFSEMEMHLVINPVDGKRYRRYIYTVGLDIGVKDNKVFKHPEKTSPYSFHIAKHPDLITNNERMSFKAPYATQVKFGRSIRDKRCRRLLYLPKNISGQDEDSDNNEN